MLNSVLNVTSIQELKDMYITKLDPKKADGLSADRLRLFCLGKELKDDLFIYSYDI